MTFATGVLAIAFGNIVLLSVFGFWNQTLHWLVGLVALLVLALAWVLYWDEDVQSHVGTE